MSQIETEVTGEVREYHYKCTSDRPHEFSIMLKQDDSAEPGKQMECVMNNCFAWAHLQGTNPAEIAKNPVELLEQ